jgi:hypothetical protein
MQGEDQGEAKEKANKKNLQHLHQQGAMPYLIKKKKNGKVKVIKANKQANKGKGAKRIWVLEAIISTMKSTKMVWLSRGK